MISKLVYVYRAFLNLINLAQANYIYTRAIYMHMNIILILTIDIFVSFSFESQPELSRNYFTVIRLDGTTKTVRNL